MTESATMTLIAVALGIAVFYFLLVRAVRAASDARLRDLSDYLLVFRRGLEVLIDERWLVLIPLGIALFGWALQFAYQARTLIYLSGLGFHESFGSYFFSGGLSSPHYVLSATIGAMPYLAPNALVTVGTYNLVAPGLIYFPVCYALMFLLGFNKIRDILGHAEDDCPRFLRRLLYPSLACSLLVLFLYGSLFGTLGAGDSITGQWTARLAYWIGHLGLGGLFFAFFMGLFTYVVYRRHSPGEAGGPIDLKVTFASAEPLLLLWVVLMLVRGPIGYMLNPPPVGSPLFPGLIFFVLCLSFSLLLIFVPMIIVTRRQRLVEAVRLSLSIWKTEYPRILTFMIVASALSLAARVFSAGLQNAAQVNLSWLDTLLSTVALCIHLAVHLWIMASWVGLFHKLNPERIETPLDDGSETLAPESIP